MNLTGHILLKDLRRLRWPVLVWLAIVIGRLVNTIASPEFAIEDRGLQAAAANLSGLLAILDNVLLVLLISWLVHDEPLHAPDAFWLTRPIRPAALMGAKLVFACLFLVVAPVLVQATGAAVITRSFGDSLHMIAAPALLQLSWVAVLIAIATLTPSLTRFLLTIGGILGAFVLVIAVGVIWSEMRLDAFDPSISYHESMLPPVTADFLAPWLFLAVLLAVIVSQYQTRRLKLGLLVIPLGVVLSIVVDGLWPGRLIARGEPDPGPWAHDTTRVIAALDRDVEPSDGDFLSLGRNATPRRKQVALPIRLTGVPSIYGNPSVSVWARLDFSDGRSLESAQGLTVSVRREDGRQPENASNPTQAALEPARLLGLLGRREPRGYDSWPIVLVVTDDEYEQYAHTPGRLTALVHTFLYRSRVVGSLPLVEGATFRDRGVRVELRRVRKGRDACSVLIRQTAIESSPGAGSPYQFVLRNRRRAEAVLGDGGDGLRLGQPFPPAFGPSMVSLRVPAATGLAFSHQLEHYPALSPFGPAPKIDAAWLDDADLAVIDTEYAGRITRSLSIDGFTMAK
jgi:hypothetical protein